MGHIEISAEVQMKDVAHFYQLGEVHMKSFKSPVHRAVADPVVG